MNLPDSFYIALCMTVLLVGAVYWVWTQIQYVQRKVNVLENIVYELKTLCSKPPSPDLYGGGVGIPTSPKAYTDPVETVEESQTSSVASVPPSMSSMLHDTLRREIETLQSAMNSSSPVVSQTSPQMPPQTPAPMPEEDVDGTEAIDGTETADGVDTTQVDDAAMLTDAMLTPAPAEPVGFMDIPETVDLQPGGIGSGFVDAASALEAMTLKELKRLGQQRGVVGYSEMKKKELIAAIRALPSDGFSEM